MKKYPVHHATSRHVQVLLIPMVCVTVESMTEAVIAQWYSDRVDDRGFDSR
jgi:hypothetical protein